MDILKNQEHITIGLFIGLIVGILSGIRLINFNLSLLIVFVVFSVMGSLFPDVVEPPVSWKHRKFFHSWSLLGILVILGIGLFLVVISSGNSVVYLLLGFVSGYSAHLIADATTPMGLPLM